VCLGRLGIAARKGSQGELQTTNRPQERFEKRGFALTVSAEAIQFRPTTSRRETKKDNPNEVTKR
jgi:hypothetical protein